MNSRDARRLYSGYLDGELSAEEEDRLKAHLGASAADAADYRAFEATVELLRSLPREEADARMTSEIISRVRNAGARGALSSEPRRGRVRHLLPLAATLLLGFATAFLMIQLGPFGGSSVAGGGGESGALAGADRVAGGQALSDAFEQHRFDRPLRQVGSGTDTPSIVF